MTLVLPLLMAIAAPKAQGPPVPRALHTPVRVTAGESNQLLGELHRDGRTLFFTSDRDATTQIYAQNLFRGGAQLVWDADSDVTTPRLSPNGKMLLYVSYERDATGDICLMGLGKPEDRWHRCLSGSGGAETQPFWYPDGKWVGAVSRPGVHADLQLRRWSATGGKSKGEVVLDRNLTGPAISPDGTWLAYVPVKRSSDSVGVNFAQKAEKAIEMVRLSEPDKVVRFNPDLPGVSGFPAFSKDGRWLYFAQYLNDTNFDGVTNGSDHAVVFRTPFRRADSRPVQAGKAEQLTSARWNCQYPSPAADRLIMTCARHGSLDVYTLPLAGSVPGQWDAKRLREEIVVSRGPWQRLLLYGRLAAMGEPPEVRRRTLQEITALHLQLGEYASARFYAEQARVPGWSEVMVQLVEHRRDERLLNRGQLSRRFLDIQKARLRALELAGEKGDASVRALTDVARVEVLDVIGREQDALDLLSSMDLASIKDPLVLFILAGRPLGVLLDLGLADRWRDSLFALAAHESLDDQGRLHFSNMLVEELLRGVGKSERKKRMTSWRAKADQDGELALLLDVHLALLALPMQDSEPVRKELFEIYKRARKVPRRRAVVMAILTSAAHHDDPYLLYQFANSWVSWLRRANAERKHGEALWRDVVLEQAYLEKANGKIGAARGSFFTVTLQTDSFEAHAGFVEGRRAEGHKDIDIRKDYDKRYPTKKDRKSPVYRYVRAYFLHQDKPAKALADIRLAARRRPQAPELHQLWGLLLHRRFAKRGDKTDALQAYEHYILALDLARERPRIAAVVDQMAGVLQASVGNHRLALSHYERRLRWPFLDAGTELSLRTARARSMFMSDQDVEAAEEIGKALAIAQGDKALLRFLPLLRDRVALYRYAAGQPEEALALYQKAPAGFRRDLMIAASGLAAGKGDPAAVGRARASLQKVNSLPLRDRYNAGFEDYELLLDGLEGAALVAAGRPKEADAPMAGRVAILEKRFEDAQGFRVVLDLAAAAFQRSRYALEAKDRASAIRHAKHGLERSDEYDEVTGSPWNPVGLRLTLLLAELRLAHGAPASAFAGGDAGLAARVGRAYKALCDRPNPRREAERFVLGLYLTMLGAQQ